MQQSWSDSKYSSVIFSHAVSCGIENKVFFNAELVRVITRDAYNEWVLSVAYKWGTG